MSGQLQCGKTTPISNGQSLINGSVRIIVMLSSLLHF